MIPAPGNMARTTPAGLEEGTNGPGFIEVGEREMRLYEVAIITNQ